MYNYYDAYDPELRVNAAFLRLFRPAAAPPPPPLAQVQRWYRGGAFRDDPSLLGRIAEGHGMTESQLLGQLRSPFIPGTLVQHGLKPRP